MSSDTKKQKDPRQDTWTTNSAIHRLESLGYTVIPPAGKRKPTNKKPVEEMTQEELVAELDRNKAVKKHNFNKYLQKHPEKRREYAKRYAETHREQMREANRRAYQKRKAREQAIKDRLSVITEDGIKTGEEAQITKNLSVILEEGDNV